MDCAESVGLVVDNYSGGNSQLSHYAPYDALAAAAAGLMSWLGCSTTSALWCATLAST